MNDKLMLSERDKFEVFWRKEMNTEAMDLHRCEFPMIAYEDQPYACHETERGRLTWMARAGVGHQVNQPSDPVAVFEIDASGYRARIVLDPAKPFPSSGTNLYVQQPAPVAQAPQCAPCNGRGSISDDDGIDMGICNFCDGSGAKSAVVAVMPEVLRNTIHNTLRHYRMGTLSDG